MTDTKKALALRNASEKLLRSRVAQLAGLQYEDSRDVWKVAGYPTHYSFAEGWSRYKRQDITRRIIDAPVEKTWRHKPEILEDGEAETEFTEAWDEVWDRLSLGARFPQADRMASIGEFSVLLLGLAGVAEDRQMKEPVNPADIDGPEDVLYVRAFKQEDVTVNAFVDDHEDPRHGLPETYQIDLGASDAGRLKRGGKLGSIVVHWTRVVHIVEDPLDSDVYGLPRLQRVLNRLIDMEKIAAATGEAYWQEAVRKFIAKIDGKSGITDDELEALADSLEDMAHDLLRNFIIQGVDVDTIGGETPDPSGAADLIMMLISAASGIPKRILFGTETGERASEQDERAFLGMVAGRIEQYAEPTIIRQFTDRLISFGALPEPTGPYTFVWRPLFELSELQQAEVNQARAETAAKLVGVGGQPLTVAEITEEGEVILRPTEGGPAPGPPEPPDDVGLPEPVEQRVRRSTRPRARSNGKG